MGRKKKIAALCGGIAVAAVLGYAAYVLLTYHRIPDGKETGIEKKAENHVLKEEQSYTISSYNIGFGAYTPEFTFFMDGGKQSVAESPESVVICVKGGRGGNSRNFTGFCSVSGSGFEFHQKPSHQ